MKKITMSDPSWAKRASHIDSKPGWVDKIPRELWELGKVFFPIPRLRKAWEYPHHLDGFRYEADDEVLNAYLESGWGYGIACANDLAVVDIDEKEKIDEVTDELPETLWQQTGSRKGVHLIYSVEDLDTRIILHYEDEHDCDNDDHTCTEDDDGNCDRETDWSHLGEVKCDPHGYVIGPGSIHPSGNIYGPLMGKEMTSISKAELVESLDDFIKPNECNNCAKEIEDEETFCDKCAEDRLDRYNNPGEYDEDVYSVEYDFYSLTCKDVIPWLEPGTRVPHPVHGSSTGQNFMRVPDSEAFMCWRHDYGGSQGCALNPQQFLAVKHTNQDCDQVKRSWGSDRTMHWYAWKQAVDEGLISFKDIPYNVAIGYAMLNGLVERSRDLKGDVYWDTINSIRMEVQKDHLRQVPPSEDS